MVGGQPYVPRQGDVVWLSFDPQVGREQSGRRPALILSPEYYNSRSQLALVCPITSRIKHYPFEVALPPGLPVAGVILSDQIRSLDWHGRQAEFICKLPPGILAKVYNRFRVLLPNTKD